MDRRTFLKNSAGCIVLLSITGCNKKEEFYKASDFIEIPKIDVHFHYNLANDVFLKYADSVRMHLVSINVDAGELVEKQLEIVTSLKENHPDKIDFLGTFSVDHFGQDHFADEAIASIDRCMRSGARGIKIWKNIGMVLQDSSGSYVMADNPGFTPVFSYMEKNRIPLMAHLGEPKNCWLPYDEITMASDLRYYQRHPEYHLYQHPEVPSYEEQIAARDRLLEKHPDLIFVGAHIGSLEWSVDEVSRHFEKYPNFNIDLSARMGNIQYQVIGDRDKVRNFFIRYQDRILYGSDITIDDENSSDEEQRKKGLYDVWLSHWQFLATDEIIDANKFADKKAPEKIQGLCLPKKVIDKIFFKNAHRIFKL